MKRVILILPGVVGDPDSASVLRSSRPGLARLAERGRVVRLAPNPPDRIPEAAYLGIPELAIAPGPLAVAAFGANPPAKSLQFHVSVLNQGGARILGITPNDRKAILEAAKRLETRRLTFVAGDDLDHALVMEDTRGELVCTPPASLDDWRRQLPEGDDEKAIRLFIDDSVNLLSESEVNQRRIDDGLPAVDLLWPWGPGFPVPTPHLGLKYGEIGQVFSNRLRLAGLTRLVSWKHAVRTKFGEGTAIRLPWLLAETKSQELSIVVTDSTWQFRKENRLDELDWIVSEIDRELVTPLLEEAEPPALTLLTPGPHGLALIPSPEPNFVPFDERAFEERIPTLDIAEVVDAAIRAGGTRGSAEA